MAYIEDYSTERLETFIKNDMPISLYYTLEDGERLVTTVNNKVQENGKRLTEDEGFLESFMPEREFICNISVEEMKEEISKRENKKDK